MVKVFDRVINPARNLGDSVLGNTQENLGKRSWVFQELNKGKIARIQRARKIE